jgi:hypothetical protein
MKYNLVGDKEYTVDENKFMKIAHFKAYTGNAFIEFTGNDKNDFYIHETKENRFTILQFYRPNKTVKTWELCYRVVQSESFAIRVHQDHTNDAVDYLE